MKGLACLCGLLFCGALAGCSTGREKSASIPHTGDVVRDGESMLASGPAKDRVLWEYRMAAAEMRRFQYADAKRLLDDALLTIGGPAVNDKSAKKARSYFSEESKKTFHGEP